MKTFHAIAAAGLAAIGLLAAGCGSSSPSGGVVAHLDTTASNAAATSAIAGANSSPTSAQSTQLVKFAQCVRAHGVPDFPDPQDGHLIIKGGPGQVVDPSSPQFQAATAACKSLRPAGLGSGQASAQIQATALKFSACMRSHGVPKFPDPSFQGGGVRLAIQPASGIDPSSPQFQAAQRACQSLLPGGAP